MSPSLSAVQVPRLPDEWIVVRCSCGRRALDVNLLRQDIRWRCQEANCRKVQVRNLGRLTPTQG